MVVELFEVAVGDITYDILGICCFEKRSVSSCFLLNPTCLTLIARPGDSYQITEPNQMTSDPESRRIEYSFFNNHLHLKWFLLKIFCWLFKDPNTSQPIRRVGIVCSLSLWYTVASQWPAVFYCTWLRISVTWTVFFSGAIIEQVSFAIYFYNQVIYVIWFVESHCLVLYFTYKCRKRLCVFQACPVRNSCSVLNGDQNSYWSILKSWFFSLILVTHAQFSLREYPNYDLVVCSWYWYKVCQCK